jgi:hypothetical protein
MTSNDKVTSHTKREKIGTFVKDVKSTPQKIRVVKSIYKHRKPLNLRNIPKVPGKWHIYCMILNIFLCGVGTIVASRLTISSRKRKLNLMYGIFQLVLFPLLIGYGWSIYWGILIYIRNTKLHRFGERSMDAILA